MRDSSMSLSPDREVVYRDFRKVGECCTCPRMEFTIYHATAFGHPEIFSDLR